jgi:hypothetical protein
MYDPLFCHEMQHFVSKIANWGQFFGGNLKIIIKLAPVNFSTTSVSGKSRSRKKNLFFFIQLFRQQITEMDHCLARIQKPVVTYGLGKFSVTN